MELSRMAELLRPFTGATALAPEQLQALSTYLDLLLRWNARTNLTAVRDEESIVMRHFGESLFAAGMLLASGSTLSVVDVGSGAGFPGLPLKVHSPAVSLTLIESQNKKATFLREAIRAMRLPDVRVYEGRAEQYTGRADLVTMRAVERFEAAVPIAAALVRRMNRQPVSRQADIQPELSSPAAGRLALLIGSAQIFEAKKLLPDFAWQPAEPIPGASARVLLTGCPMTYD